MRDDAVVAESLWSNWHWGGNGNRCSDWSGQRGGQVGWSVVGHWGGERHWCGERQWGSNWHWCGGGHWHWCGHCDWGSCKVSDRVRLFES